MLYCLTVEKDSENRLNTGVEWRGPGPIRRASMARAASVRCGHVEGRAAADDVPPLSRNSRAFTGAAAAPLSVTRICGLPGSRLDGH